MLGLASTLASSLSDKQVYASLTGAPGDNLASDTSNIVSPGPDQAYSGPKQNGQPFYTGYTTSSTFRGSWTISFWMKAEDWTDTNRTAGKFFWSISDGTNGTDYWITNISSVGQISTIGISNSTGIMYAVTGITPSDGDWIHFATVVNGGGGSDTTVAHYLNGSAISTTTLLSMPNARHVEFDASNGLYIGQGSPTTATAGHVPGAGLTQNDFMDDFCLHSSALDADNIAAIYNSGTPINLLANSGNYDSSGDVVLYYRFNGEVSPSGTQLDSHGTSNATGGTFSTQSVS